MRTCITPQVKGWFSAKRVQDPEATPGMIKNYIYCKMSYILLSYVLHYYTLFHLFVLQLYQERVKVILLNIGGFINYDSH